MLITTAASLAPRMVNGRPDEYHPLRRILRRHKGHFLFVGDELHSLGTKQRLLSLPENAQFRLGLSATPKRHSDEEGTEALLEYFGDPVVSISIKEAIYEHGALVEYDYHPLQVELTEEEATEYRRLSALIAQAYQGGDPEKADQFIRLRVRVTQHAAGKLDQLRELMRSKLKGENGQIIYVAEGKSPETDAKQLEEVQFILQDEFGMTAETYFGETESHQRMSLQRNLANGSVQALIAMKCLDEGVDIPAARIGVFMASTQNPRQFVQRRGRLLRKDPHAPKTHAEIYDFIVMPPAGQAGSASETTLIGTELGRAVELAEAARNSEVRFDLIEWAYRYNLDPAKYSWMNLDGEQEMEKWTK